jgi:hypothetical protein
MLATYHTKRDSSLNTSSLAVSVSTPSLSIYLCIKNSPVYKQLESSIHWFLTRPGIWVVVNSTHSDRGTQRFKWYLTFKALKFLVFSRNELCVKVYMNLVMVLCFLNAHSIRRWGRCCLSSSSSSSSCSVLRCSF